VTTATCFAALAERRSKSVQSAKRNSESTEIWRQKKFWKTFVCLAISPFTDALLNWRKMRERNT
jgi:hypothetical protein